ncbi:MAG: hypothetical protein R6V30_02425 [Paracoccaceae bacterium]
MMPTLRPFTAAVALLLLAAPLQAKEINVRIERGGFYPTVVYAQPNDTIRFHNTMQTVASLSSANYYSTRPDWKLNGISSGTSKTITVQSGMEPFVRAPCLNNSNPKWWQYGSHTEPEMTQLINNSGNPSYHENDFCNGWSYNRFHNMLEIVIGDAPLGNGLLN